MSFLEELKDRKIRKWVTIYVSAAITSIGVIHLLSIRYDLPDYIFDFVFFTLLFGVGGTLLISWFHGKAGRQKIKKIEIIIHSVLFITWLIVLAITLKFDSTEKGIGDTKTIAVLPFSNFNETSDSEFFADGITDDVLTQLSKISDLKVISRTSVMKYKNTDLSIPEISRKLGAGTILEGSVRTIGNKVRIIGQLIDANNDVHIWSETYDRELEDIFDIQSDIAERIAAALHAKLLPLEQERIETKYTSDIDAYTYYLKGKNHYYNYTEEENAKAITAFREALKIDSTYALAYAGLADALSQNVSKYWHSDELLDSVLFYSKKSLTINPDLAEGYKALASGYQSLEEYQLALENYRKAIDLNPNFWSAILNYGQVKTFVGEHDEAVYWIRKANELTPNELMGNLSVSMVYKSLNCDSAAISWGKKTLLLDPENKYVNTYLGDIYLGTGDLDKAESYFNTSIELDSNWILGWFLGGRIEAMRNNPLKAKEYYDKYIEIAESSPEWFYAHSLLEIGETDSANSIINGEIKEYEEYFKTSANSQVFDYIALAEMYAISGDKENSIKWLRTGINKGFIDIRRFTLYPYLNNIKTDPRYNSLLTVVQIKIDSFKSEVENKYPEYFDCN